MGRKTTIYTIGHSTHTLPEFIKILQNEKIQFLVDVRTIPKSRTNPQFNRDTLPVSLKPEHINYRHIAALGGLRSRQKKMETSPNTFWENKSFRNYADYALTEDFQHGLTELKKIAETARCAIMCAEVLWWRCHRRIISDYLISEGYTVMHIMKEGKADLAQMTNGARPAEERKIFYDAPIS